MENHEFQEKTWLPSIEVVHIIQHRIDGHEPYCGDGQEPSSIHFPKSWSEAGAIQAA